MRAVDGQAARATGNRKLLPEYGLWKSIRQRCNTPTYRGYKAFGGRGIRVCSAWDSFEQFLADMGARPEWANTVERIDPNGNYAPANCQWGSTSQRAARTILTKKADLTQRELRRLFDYDEATGIFTRREPAAGATVGAQIGTVDGNGYMAVRIGRYTYRLHRLAWLYVHGVWPSEIDHINRVKTDNRIVNLRDVDHCVNAQNAVTGPLSRTGVRGVAHHPASGKFAAYISRFRRKLWLGVFSTVEEAAAARRRAEQEVAA